MTKTELDEVDGTSASVLVTIYNWISEFKRGSTFTNDEHRLERPVEVTFFEIIHKIHDTVLNTRCIRVQCFYLCTKKSVWKKFGKIRCHVCSAASSKTGAVDFFLFPNLPKKMHWRKKIHVERDHHSKNLHKIICFSIFS